MRDVPRFLKEPDPEVYLGEDYLVIDFETTNLDKGDARNPHNNTVCVGWTGPQTGEGVRVEWGGTYKLPRFLSAVRNAKFIVAHRAKVVLHSLRRCAVPLYDMLV